MRQQLEGDIFVRRSATEQKRVEAQCVYFVAISLDFVVALSISSQAKSDRERDER